ncbi:hypothetical protein D3C76_433270 [compost metagenome]
MAGEAVQALRHAALRGQAAGQRQYRDDVAEATDQHGQADHQVVEHAVGAETGKGRAVVGGARGVGVQQLAETVGAGVAHRSGRPWQAGGDGAQDQYADRHHQQGRHQQLHFPRLQLLAQVFRGAADHQPSEEHGDQHEQQHAVEPGTDTAEDHLADHHVDHRHHAGQWVEAVVHVVDRAVGGGGGGHRPQHRTGGAEAAFLAFQGRTLLHLGTGQRGIDLLLRPQRDTATDEEQAEHAGKDCPALAQVLDVVAEGEHQGYRDEDDRCHLEQVAPRRGVFQRVG